MIIDDGTVIDAKEFHKLHADIIPSADDVCQKYRSKDESSKEGKLSKNYHG